MTANEVTRALEDIAEEHLDVRTLKSRGRDSLDFHTVGVVSLKAALEAAYRAGAESQSYVARRARED